MCYSFQLVETNRFLAEEELGEETVIPRHREVINFTARKICTDLDVPMP